MKDKFKIVIVRTAKHSYMAIKVFPEKKGLVRAAEPFRDKRGKIVRHRWASDAYFWAIEKAKKDA